MSDTTDEQVALGEHTAPQPNPHPSPQSPLAPGASRGSPSDGPLAHAATFMHGSTGVLKLLVSPEPAASSQAESSSLPRPMSPLVPPAARARRSRSERLSGVGGAEVVTSYLWHTGSQKQITN
jgi:hypothetical protein